VCMNAHKILTSMTNFVLSVQASYVLVFQNFCFGQVGSSKCVPLHINICINVYT